LPASRRIDIPPEKFDIDLGYDHYLKFYCWKPCRDLNPQYDKIPDIEKAGAIITHKSKNGDGDCTSGVTFDSEDARKIQITSRDHYWKVESWEPLTLSPSLLCLSCGDHGFIREGRWVPA
jgi:hypothetical protein